MKFSKKIWFLAAILLAAIGYTVYNYFTGYMDGDAAVLYILVLSFPLVRMLSAALQQWKGAQ